MNSQKARLRILELQKAGFVRKEMISMLGGRRVIRLTERGISVAKQEHHLDIPQARHLDIPTLTHDAIVTSVALRLAQLWEGTWIPERALKKTDYSQIPDGVFVFDNQKKIAIEVENSIKGRRRFLGLLERWRSVDVLLVLYISTSNAIHETVKRYLSQGPKKPAFALVPWRDLKDGIPSVWSTEGELEIFNKKEL
ncbi:hypothetical protein WDW86_10190 [Bdellovibrionota bacterium FG-2]